MWSSLGEYAEHAEQTSPLAWLHGITVASHQPPQQPRWVCDRNLATSSDLGPALFKRAKVRCAFRKGSKQGLQAPATHGNIWQAMEFYMRKFAHSHTLKQQVVHGFSYSYPWKELRCPTLEHSKCRERMLSWADISNSSPCKEAVRSHQNWQTRPIWLLWYFEAPGHKAATDATDDATPNLAVFKRCQIWVSNLPAAPGRVLHMAP